MSAAARRISSGVPLVGPAGERIDPIPREWSHPVGGLLRRLAGGRGDEPVPQTESLTEHGFHVRGRVDDECGLPTPSRCGQGTFVVWTRGGETRRLSRRSSPKAGVLHSAPRVSLVQFQNEEGELP
jgi:hypothetical protein